MDTVGKVITRYEFTSENHFGNWLFKIHKNNILQFLRSKKSKEKIFNLFLSMIFEVERGKRVE